MESHRMDTVLFFVFFALAIVFAVQRTLLALNKRMCVVRSSFVMS